MSVDSVSSTELERHLAAQVTLARYAAALDEHELDALEAVHVPDATWTFSAAGQRALEPIEGRDAILAFVTSTPQRPGERQRHIVTNIVVVRGRADVLDVTGCLLLTSNTDGVTTVAGTALIRARLTGVADQWKISALHIDFDSAPPAGPSASG